MQYSNLRLLYYNWQNNGLIEHLSCAYKLMIEINYTMQGAAPDYTVYQEHIPDRIII